jgi:hypothetical protein
MVVHQVANLTTLTGYIGSTPIPSANTPLAQLDKA